MVIIKKINSLLITNHYTVVAFPGIKLSIQIKKKELFYLIRSK